MTKFGSFALALFLLSSAAHAHAVTLWCAASIDPMAEDNKARVLASFTTKRPTNLKGALTMG